MLKVRNRTITVTAMAVLARRCRHRVGARFALGGGGDVRVRSSVRLEERERDQSDRGVRAVLHLADQHHLAGEPPYPGGGSLDNSISSVVNNTSSAVLLCTAASYQGICDTVAAGATVNQVAHNDRYSSLRVGVTDTLRRAGSRRDRRRSRWTTSSTAPRSTRTCGRTELPGRGQQFTAPVNKGGDYAERDCYGTTRQRDSGSLRLA